MKKSAIAFYIIVFSVPLFAADDYREVRLDRRWKFEIGNNERYAEPDFDDSDWDDIRVSKRWEDQGYPGYDGYAWYRTRFYLPEKLEGKSLFLHLGSIDDVDRVYVNGHFIGGKGSFPPNYKTAYSEHRRYYLPDNTLEFDEENVIAVCVYDYEMDGGLRWGKIGIYSEFSVKLHLGLTGSWKFSTGDSEEWSKTDYDDSKWEQMLVPSTWESQDYPYLDGYGWYRKTFQVEKKLPERNLILAVGKIDDIDEVYLNGTRIGRTGRFPGEGSSGNHWSDERYYFIPPNLIQWNKKNLIAVRVYDTGGEGGIYEGPVGITTRKEYLDYKKQRRKRKSSGFFEDIFEGWFEE